MVSSCFVTVAWRHDDSPEHIRWGRAAGSEEHRPDRWPSAEPGRGPEEQHVWGHTAQPQPQPHWPIWCSHPAGRSASEASGHRLTVSPRNHWSTFQQHLREEDNRIWKKIRSWSRNISLLTVFQYDLEKNIIKPERQLKDSKHSIKSWPFTVELHNSSTLCEQESLQSLTLLNYFSTKEYRTCESICHTDVDFRMHTKTDKTQRPGTQLVILYRTKEWFGA